MPSRPHPAEGGTAKAYAANVLKKETLLEAREQIRRDFGTCDILVNGAGGNNPRATTTNEYYLDGDMEKDITTFFNLEPAGVEFVFNLNFLGTLIPTQVFAEDMLGKEDACILNVSSMNAFTPLTKIPAYSGAKAAVSNFTQWLAVHFSKANIRVNAIAPGFFVTAQNQALLFDEAGNPTARTAKILNSTPMGRFGRGGGAHRLPALSAVQTRRRLHHRRGHPRGRAASAPIPGSDGPFLPEKFRIHRKFADAAAYTVVYCG